MTELLQTVGQRRLVGTIEGRLRKPRPDEAVDVRAAFDIDLPCGTAR